MVDKYERFDRFSSDSEESSFNPQEKQKNNERYEDRSFGRMQAIHSLSLDYFPQFSDIQTLSDMFNGPVETIKYAVTSFNHQADNESISVEKRIIASEIARVLEEEVADRKRLI